MTTTKMARAWAIARSDGLVLGFTDHDEALEFEGIVFRPQSGMTAQAVVQGAGLSVDNTEAIGVLSDDAITERDLLAGRWDRAELRLWEVDWRAVKDRRLVFRGSLGEVSRAGGGFRAELRGLSDVLNQPVGRVYHPRCGATLGDARCRVNLNRPGLSGEGEVAELDGARLILRKLGGFDDRWFERGRLEFSTGAAAGLSGHVKIDRPRPDGLREVELWEAPGIAPAPGDAVRVFAGCDKAAETCRHKFANFLNFRGFPHLPVEDWLMAPGQAQARAGDEAVGDMFGGGDADAGR